MSQSLLGSNTFNHMSEFVFRRARPHWAESYPPYSGFLNWVSHFHARWTHREEAREDERLASEWQTKYVTSQIACYRPRAHYGGFVFTVFDAALLGGKDSKNWKSLKVL